MDKKRESVEKLKKLMHARRAQIDPKILALVKDAALRAQASKPGAKTVPYDKKAAEKSVELFLKDHPEQKQFRAKLLKFIEKSGK